MKFFVITKHWVLFLITITLWFLFILFLSELLPPDETVRKRIYSVSGFILTTVSIFWCYSIFTTFSKQIPGGVKISVFTFRSCILTILILNVLDMVVYTRPISMVVWSGDVIGLICMIYASYNAALVLISVEKRHAAAPKELLLPTLGIIFSIVGIWFLQPRINKLSERSTIPQ